jgi:hypothetical protein
MSQEILLDLTKTFELNLEKAGVVNIPTLEVMLAVDKSGSMGGLYRQGYVDRAVNLFLPLALKFDDNSQIEVGFFNSEFEEAPFALPEDCGKYLKKSGQSPDGGTNFAPIIEAFETKRGSGVVDSTVAKAKGFFGRMFGKSEPTAAPAPTQQTQFRAYAGIITDGANFDKREFEAELAKTNGNTFYQFIGIGNGVETAYLTGIAAKYPHVAYFELRDPTNFTDDKFYQEIVNSKFTAWM